MQEFLKQSNTTKNTHSCQGVVMDGKVQQVKILHIEWNTTLTLEKGWKVHSAIIDDGSCFLIVIREY